MGEVEEVKEEEVLEIECTSPWGSWDGKEAMMGG